MQIFVKGSNLYLIQEIIDFFIDFLDELGLFIEE
jgi:hypothetical protein